MSEHWVPDGNGGFIKDPGEGVNSLTLLIVLFSFFMFIVFALCTGGFNVVFEVPSLLSSYIAESEMSVSAVIFSITYMVSLLGSVVSITWLTLGVVFKHKSNSLLIPLGLAGLSLPALFVLWWVFIMFL